VRTAAGTADFDNSGTTDTAWCILLSENLEVVAEVTLLATGVCKMLKGGTTNGNRFAQDITGSLGEFL
jgi:hypothetical protein